MLSCERCSVEVGYNDEENAEIRMQEVQMGFGITTFMCFECRKAWNAFTVQNTLIQEYSEAGFRLNCWKAIWRKKPGSIDEAEEGIAPIA